MSSTAEFDKLYGQLNPRQREAVDAIDGPVMVIAGPGTGKTKILTLRIANILAKTDATPEAILALTFTESGATEMRARLAQIIGVAAYRVTVTTFHSFCNDIIQQYPESFGDIAGAAPITETDQFAIVQELIESSDGLDLLRPPGAPLLYLKAIIHTINTLKREDVSPEQLSGIAADETTSVMNSEDLYHSVGRYKGQMKGVYSDQLKQTAKLAELAVLYTRYQAILRERRLYDYNDMIMEVARVLAHDEQLRLMLQEQYQYVLVDEHQDTNNGQNRIIELLASFWDEPNLFVVGDAHQAIYRFQGASLGNFLYFKNLYPNVKLIELQDNYRSSQTILDAAHGVHPSSGNGLRAQTDHVMVPITIMTLSETNAELYSVAQHIKDRITNGSRPEDIAVLYRDNADGRELAQFFDALALPYTIADDADLLSDSHIQKLMLILDAVRDFGETGPLLKALYVDTLRIEPLDTYKLADFCRMGRNPYDVMRSPTLCHQAGIENTARMSDLAAMFARWHTAARNEPTAQTFQTIVRESGILQAMLSSTRVTEKLAKLHALYDMAKSLVQRNRTFTLIAFVDHLRFIQEHGLIIKSASGTPMPGRVRLMTAHKSKGLEFDHVYMIGATDEHWGPRNRRELIKLPSAVAGEKGDDERNVFYVALTRARKSVTITLAQRSSDGRDYLPCRYISDMKPELLVYPDTTAFEADWISHRDIHFAAPLATSPDISDKAFLNDIFRRQGLSATALNNYLDCPWKYFYRNLVRIPEAPVFPLMYGSAVDRALQEYFERVREGEKPDKQYLLTAFRQFAHHQPFQEQELQTALTKGERALSGYFDKYHSQWHSNVLNQFKVAAISLPISPGDDIVLNGKIDRIDILDSANRVIVIDYKTGKAKTRREIIGQTKDADGNYFRQLAFYNLLLNHHRDGYYTMTKGVLDFVDPDQKGQYHREEFLIEPAHVHELTETIKRVATEILNVSFWNSRCDDKDCQYCKLRKLTSMS